MNAISNDNNFFMADSFEDSTLSVFIHSATDSGSLEIFVIGEKI
jgi:hypothetical protein